MFFFVSTAAHHFRLPRVGRRGRRRTPPRRQPPPTPTQSKHTWVRRRGRHPKPRGTAPNTRKEGGRKAPAELHASLRGLWFLLWSTPEHSRQNTAAGWPRAAANQIEYCLPRPFFRGLIDFWENAGRADPPMEAKIAIGGVLEMSARRPRGLATAAPALSNVHRRGAAPAPAPRGGPAPTSCCGSDERAAEAVCPAAARPQGPHRDTVTLDPSARRDRGESSPPAPPGRVRRRSSGEKSKGKEVENPPQTRFP